MKRLFKILAWTFGALVFLIVVAAIAVPLLFDPNDYRDEIGALVKRSTGRDLTISGDLKVSVFPWLGVEAGDTQLSNAPGFGPAPFARFARAKVQVKLLPLLRREVELDKMEFTSLRLHLARHRDGRSNWDDLVQSVARETPPADGEPTEKEGGLAALRLGGVAIRDAQVTWDDKTTGREAQIANLNLATGALDRDTPVELELDSDFALNAPQAAGHVTLKGTVRHDLEARRYAVDDLVMDLNARGKAVPGGAMALSLSGDAQADLGAQTASIKALDLKTLGTRLQTSLTVTRILDKPDAQGDLDLQVTDSSALVTALAAYLPAAIQLEPESLSGARVVTPFMISLSRGTASLPELRATLLGTALAARVEASKLLDKPVAKGTLRFEVKDANRLLAPVRASLPKGLKHGELTGAVIESGFDADMASESLTLDGTRLDAMDMRLTAEARGKAILSNPAFSGKLQVNEFVPRDLARKLGITLPATADPATLSKATLSTRFDVGKDHAGVEDLLLRLDQSTVKGRLAAQRFEPLKLRYDLSLDQIDVDRYLPPPSKEKPAAATGAATAPLKLPLTQLRALDIDGTVRVGKLKAANLHSTEMLATLRAQNGLFRVQPASAKLYQGTYSGNLGLDVRGATPLLSMDEKLQGVQIGPLLKDFMGKEYVTGKARLSAKLTARGTEVTQIRRTLNGNAAFAFENGTVNEVNILELLLKDYAKYLGQPTPKDEPDKTDFTEMRGTAKVKDGLVSNQDLTLTSPALRIAGKGTASLVTEKVSYRLDTTVVSSKGTLAQLKGQTIPVLVGGTFSNLKFGVDVGAVLEAKARQAVEAEAKKLQKRLEEEGKKKGQEVEKQLQDKLKEMLKIR